MNRAIFETSEYDWQIPRSLIAQEPATPRDSSRLLVINRKKSTIKQGIFTDIVSFFNKGDVLVLNNTKVIKARLVGRKESGSKLEILLLKEKQKGIWQALVKPGKRARINDTIIFGEGRLQAKIIDKTGEGLRILQFYPKDFESLLLEFGKVPLPPYIKREMDDFGPYQTIYAQKKGAVAAPTAGLHFTKELIDNLRAKGVEVVYITLHCGLATFRPVKAEDIRDHNLGPEWLEVLPQVAKQINSAKKQSRRVIAVGTTTIRTLESLASLNKKGEAFVKDVSGETNLYILPGYKFKIIDAIITNFHTPHSTNLILISSFCGLSLLKRSYMYAKLANFRFYSFGDAMLIT